MQFFVVDFFYYFLYFLITIFPLSYYPIIHFLLNLNKFCLFSFFFSYILYYLIYYLPSQFHYTPLIKSELEAQNGHCKGKGSIPQIPSCYYQIQDPKYHHGYGLNTSSVDVN